ncbi:hypothetical protein P154DRAFT_547083 [Amniculicola lignicola CBS 123094]|uniref:dolichol kinase n=1 Tax=Amniculicola lignicola CBS 123094 TaxID=1392246 RepID=A0A6A5W8G7_9PLEO|nr:hypothetical protein P154DRAFT_547083 [Amniculicola lignicola CBS 123094]
MSEADVPEGHLEPNNVTEIEALELFRRSPHPYLRHQNELRRPQASSESSSNDYSRTSLNPTDCIVTDEDGRKRRKLSQSPSDSGTEADDEGYGFVKALPAPPLRLHKGLRDLRGSGLDGSASPLLTPSQVDEEGRKFSAEFFDPGEEGAKTGEPSLTDEETRAARKKYIKRRRNELVRRTTETALLGLIGLLAVKGCGCWVKLLQWHRVELLTHVFVLSGTLSLYPLRLLLFSRRRDPPSWLRLRHRIRIPAAFDPAPIIYPTIIPVLISISLFSSFPKLLLPNIILGLAALPSQLVPCGASPYGYSMVHWFLSILPLFASEHTDLPSKILAPIPYMLKSPPPEGLHPELLASLFALHQALLPPLRYLTTTSLLSTELHLLSIGLINLLLFAETPQMEILKTLLWLGGVGLFVTCGKILKWGVALARIPRWRFRRAGQIVKARQNFLQVLNESLRLKRSHSTGGRAAFDSDADEDHPLLQNPLAKTKSLRLNILESIQRTPAQANGVETQSAIELKTTEFPDQKEPLLKSIPKRRNTLPIFPQPEETPKQHRNRTRSKSIAQSFLALTPNQAMLRKWIYAGYFYLIVVVAILGPIRYTIGEWGLHSHEPFGWAIGYLFGNIQPLRFQVLNWDLENWIALPPLLDFETLPGGLGIADHLRMVVVGEANTRLLLCGYCLAIIIVGLLTVTQLAPHFEVDTRRKVFHGMMVAMLLPTIFIDPCFIALALALILAIFLLLDLIRASQLPPLSRPLASFLTPYVDGRDLRGPVVVSHIFLLIGCAIPLWLGLAGVERTGEGAWEGWEVKMRDVSLMAGVICVGMGDAAASLIGRRYGRRKWPWAGGKSLEGSAAFALAVTIGLVCGKLWLRLGGWDQTLGVQTSLEFFWEWSGVVLKAMVCAMGASLNEAVLTGGNDNVIVPVLLWVLVRGVGL